jgi:hypothetical protein
MQRPVDQTFDKRSHKLFDDMILWSGRLAFFFDTNNGKICSSALEEV